MNITYISASEIPSRYANSVHVMKMCHAFAQHGHSTTLIAQEGEGIANEDAFRHYGVGSRFDLIRLPRTGPGFKGALGYALRIRRAIGARPVPDLFYSRYIHGALMVARTGVPMIYEAHAPPRSKFEWWQFRALFRSPNFHRLVVISRALRNIYLDNFPFLDADKVVVFHDGADLPVLESVAEMPRTEAEGGQLAAGYVGSLYAGRGLELIGEVARNCRNVDFHIIGGTPHEVETWRTRIPYSNIRWHGYVAHGQLQSYFDMLDVLLAPYQHSVGLVTDGKDTSTYMSPLKIFEYMAQRKAIVASDLPVLREVLVSEEQALLCEPDDVKAWTNALNRLTKSPELRLKLGRSAQELLRQRYTWRARAEAVIAGAVDHIHSAG